MIFKNPPRLASKEGINKYIQTDIYSWLSNVSSGLNGRLNFDENFQSFVVDDVSIPAGTTVSIPNELSVVPNERYIVRQSGNGLVTDGNWDENSLELTNNGAVTVVISVRFFVNYRKS